MRRLALALLVVAVLASPSTALEPIQSVAAETYLDLFDNSTQRGVDRPSDEVYDLFIDITGNSDVDLRIREAAEARGYQRRPVATAALVSVDGELLQAPAAEGWLTMQAAARADGVSIRMTSAFRDVDDQASLFRGRLAGRTSDSGIDAALRFAAPPGYSKHHSGYAVDIGQGGEAEGAFINTRAYAWLSAFDFAQARAHGFIPSYPADGVLMGPDPEPWEFVWVGVGRIGCAAGGVDVAGFCDVAGDSRAADIVWLSDFGVTVGCAPGEYCPDDAVTRGEAASLLWRLHGAPAPWAGAPFVDVFAADHFALAVDWLWSTGIVQGTSPVTFSPDELLTPAESFAIVIRLAESDLETLLVGSGDGAATELGDLGPQVSRAEFASILRASTG